MQTRTRHLASYSDTFRYVPTNESRRGQVQDCTIQDRRRLQSTGLDDPNINLYDHLVQGYCADLATVHVEDSKPHSAGAIICTDYKSETHETEDCPKRKQ